MTKLFSLTVASAIVTLLFISCNSADSTQEANTATTIKPEVVEPPEYFLLRPDVEKGYGYSHAVKIGNEIKIS